LIHHVDRLDDPRLAAYARVGDAAWLRAQHLFVAEGRLVVRRLFEVARYDVESVLVTPAALAALSDVLPQTAVIYVADQALLNTITGFNFHRGCLALARRPAATPASVRTGSRRLVALEGIGNPDNVGGIFRVAAAFGVDGVLLDPSSGDPLYRKAIRTSMGAALQMPFERLDRWPEALQDLKAQGFDVLALTPRTGAQPLEAVMRKAPDRWVLLAGAEGPGLSDAALAAANVYVRIPMVATVDSLNVTVAVGIALSRLCASG
jgi:tRNA G18 (ribose-2'-O)-methylase SpoU